MFQRRQGIESDEEEEGGENGEKGEKGEKGAAAPGDLPPSASSSEEESDDDSVSSLFLRPQIKLQQWDKATAVQSLFLSRGASSKQTIVMGSVCVSVPNWFPDNNL